MSAGRTPIGANFAMALPPRSGFHVCLCAAVRKGLNSIQFKTS
jgi:hypothetical protein